VGVPHIGPADDVVRDGIMLRIKTLGRYMSYDHASLEDAQSQHRRLASLQRCLNLSGKSDKNAFFHQQESFQYLPFGVAGKSYAVSDAIDSECHSKSHKLRSENPRD